MANIDFEFDFKSALAKTYRDSEIYQEICDIAKGLDLKCLKTEDAIRRLIEINSIVFSEVLKQYNYNLLNEL